MMRVLAAVVLLCLVFAAGFWARGYEPLMTALGMPMQSGTAPSKTPTAAGNAYDTLAGRVSEVEGILQKDSLDDYDLDAATQTILESYLSSTDDSFLHYYDEASYNKYLSQATNPETGIGVIFGENDEGCYVVDVFDGSQAAAMGVRAGDYIESIDGVHNRDWTMADVVSALSRNQGEEVAITWRRPADATQNAKESLFTTRLPYTVSTEENVTYALVDGVAFIDVKQLSIDSAKTFRSTLEKVQQEGAHAIVLDLRDVPGGYLTQAVEIASFFIQSGSVVQVQTIDATTTRSVSGESLSSLPLVVLVNQNTAGAAEVLAAALQESYNATIVGAATQGKGTVQVMQPLSFGGAIRYTAATYLTPSGRTLDGSGVMPDVTITDAARQYDSALDVARSEASR